MKKRQAIIESATRLFGSVGYDARELQGLLAADSFDVIHNAAHIVHEDAPEAIVLCCEIYDRAFLPI